MSLRKVAVLGGALSLFVSQMAMSVGLGDIKLNSSLNEPLDAEIELLNVGDLSELEMLVGLASRTDFERAGVAREFFLSDLQFTVDLSGGRKVIRVKSRKPVQEPYLDFLVELQWPAGRLLREYTMLVDLPVFVSEDSAAKKPQTKSVRAASTAPAARSGQSSGRSSGASDSRRGTSGDDQYRVNSGDTLWSIAQRYRPDGASIAQTITAIHEMNPDAFIGGDINLLKRGEVLRMPDRQQITGVTSSAAKATLEEGSRQLAKTQQDGPLLDAVDSSVAAPSADSEPSGRLKLAAAKTESSVEGVGSALENNVSDPSSGSQAKEALENDLAIAYEELERKSRELEELKERNRMLEEQVETQQRIVEIQDSDLRAAQLATVSPEAEPAQEPMLSTESDAVDASEAKPEKPVAATSESKSPNFWQKYFYYLIGLGGIVVLLVLALLGRSRKQVAVDEEPDFEYEEPVEPALVTTANFGGGSAQDTAAALHSIELDEDDELFASDDADSSKSAQAANDNTNEADFAGENGENSDLSSAEESADDLLLADADHLPSIDDDLFAGTGTAEDDVDEAKLGSVEGVETGVQTSDDYLSAAMSDDSDAVQEFDLDLDLDEIDLSDLSENDIGVTTDDDLAGDFTLDLDSTASESLDVDKAAAQEGELASEEEFDLLSGADEVATKLDLAKAYADMGDAQGARDILEEVLSEGDEQQQQAAQQLLEELV